MLLLLLFCLIYTNSNSNNSNRFEMDGRYFLSLWEGAWLPLPYTGKKITTHFNQKPTKNQRQKKEKGEPFSISEK